MDFGELDTDLWSEPNSPPNHQILCANEENEFTIANVVYLNPNITDVLTERTSTQWHNSPSSVWLACATQTVESTVSSL